MISHLLNGLFIVFNFAALVGGWILYRRNENWRILDKLGVAVLPLAVVFMVGLCGREMLEGPFHMWDSVRLLPSFLLSKGLPHYYGPDSGPVLDMMYGPMTAIAYYPVTWFAHGATRATLYGKIFSIIFYFVPVLWFILSRNLKDPKSKLFAILVFVGFFLYSHETEVLSGSAFTIHADAPALGLCAMACIALLQRRNKDDRSAILQSALFAVLATWTKQVTLPILIALPLYVYWVDGSKCAIRYLLCLVVLGTAIAVFFGYVFDFHKLWFNLVLNPCRQPWERAWVKIQGRAIVELIDECRWMCLLTIFYLVYAFREQRLRPGAYCRWLVAHDWSLFVLVGLLMIPTSLVGRMKAGGGLNALSFSVYFLAIGAALMMIDLVKESMPSERGHAAVSLAKGAAFFLVFSSILMDAVPLTYYYFHLKQHILELHDNPLKLGSRFAKQHPNEVYLPWMPLTSLKLEKKLYHFDYALLDRQLAGSRITPEHFRENLPSKMRWVAFPPNAQDEYVMEYLPEFTQKVFLSELPGWTVYTKPDR